MKIHDWEKYIDTPIPKEKFRKKPKKQSEEVDKPKRKKKRNKQK